MLSALRCPATAAGAILAMASAAPASAVTTAAVVHVASGAVDLAAPSSVAVPRGAELAIVNAPRNAGSYTYIVTNGTYTYSTPDSVAPGGTGTINVPADAPPGTYRLTYAAGVLLASVEVV